MSLALSDLIGDAFQADRGKQRSYGIDLTTKESSITKSSFEVPEIKSNVISYCKADDGMPSTCRNLLGLSNIYTCYVVKKCKVRVIHTSLSVNCLLRDHSPSSYILDLKFSPVSNDIMCSVDDDVSDVECSHTFIWQLLPSEGDLTSKKLLELKIRAQTCQPHPQIPYVWALSNGNKIGIISSQFTGSTYANYSDLPMNTEVDGSVMDILFTANGQYLVVTVKENSGKTHIDVWKLPTVDLLINGQGFLSKVELTNPSIVPDILSSIVTSCGFVIASNGTNDISDSSSVNILISVWPLEIIFGKNVDEKIMKPSQTLSITLPYQSNNINSQKELSISYSSTESSDSKILIISHKCSQIITCLTINNFKVFPMAHVSMFDLTWPVVFFGTTIVNGQHSDHDKEKEILEICCYQEGEKAAVQQYHIPCDMLTTITAESTIISSVKVSSLELPASLSSSIFSPSPNRSILSILQESSIQKSNSLQQVPVIQNLNVETLKSSSENVVTTPKPVHESPKPISSATDSTPPPTVHINTSTPLGSRSILNLLMNPQQSNPELETLKTVKVDSNSQVPIIACFSPPSSSQIIEQVASTSSNLSDIPDFLQAAPVSNRSILSMIKEKNQTSTPVIAPSSSPFMRTLDQESPNVSPIPITVGQAQGRSILSFLTENSQLPPNKSANVPAVVVSSIDSVVCDSENDDESSCSASETGRSCDEQIEAEIEFIDKEESSDEDWNAASDSAEVDELNTSSQMKNQKNNLNILSYDTDFSSIILSLSDIKEMTQKIQKEYVTKDSINLLKADIVRSIVKNSGDQTHQAIKKLINVETKSAVESVINTKEWKNDMISQISTSMQTDIAPIIATRVNTAVKDTVKASLTSTFRGAFENSLLPAFQAGTDRMFAQIQEAVDTGMEGLIEQGRISQQISTNATTELQEEVKSLKSTVSTLELMVVKLINANNESTLKLENMINELSKSSTNFFKNQSNSVANNDPISLLEKGLISEAVECALNKKDIHILVKLLEKITPTQMSTKCNSLTQLCAAQQLASNLASSEPEDGYSKRLSWLKSLIMGLLFAPKDTNNSDLFQQYLSYIYTYLMTASVRLTQKLAVGTENHEDCDEIASTITDIKMLTAILKNTE